MQRDNPLALASLACGVSALVLWVVAILVRAMPLVGWLVGGMTPLLWGLAIAGLLMGILGYRTAIEVDGSGRQAAVAGTTLSAVFGGIQILQGIAGCFGLG